MWLKLLKHFPTVRFGRPSRRHTFLAGAAALAAFLAIFCANSSEAHAITVKDYPEFVEITGLQPLESGGFALVGTLRLGSNQKSGFLRVSSNGQPLAPLVVLPDPDNQHPACWIAGLERLPDGDFVAAGWATGPDINPDWWLVRLTPEGEVLWNVVGDSDREEKLYSIKWLSTGKLIAVGRSQEGKKTDKSSTGLLLWIKPASGEIAEEANSFNCGHGYTRCGFQDVDELPDESLVVGGWSTSVNKGDEAWLLKLDDRGNPSKATTFGDAGDDLVRALTVVGNDIFVAGTVRGKGGKSLPVLFRYDTSLSHGTPVSMETTGLGQVRALYSLPYAERMLVAGESRQEASSNSEGFLASVHKGATRLEDAIPISPSKVSSIAIDTKSSLAVAGSAGENKDMHGFVAFKSDGSLCPATVPLKHLAPNKRGPFRETACTTSESPARFKLSLDTATESEEVVTVRSLLGDVDASFVRHDDVIDSSMNSKGLPEVLALPPEPSNVELLVSTAAPFAVFEIRAVTVQRPKTANDLGEDAEKPLGENTNDAKTSGNDESEVNDQSKDEGEQSPEDDQSVEGVETGDGSASPNEETDQNSTDDSAASSDDQSDASVDEVTPEDRLTAIALRAIGYDLMSKAVQLDSNSNGYDRRAIMAFQLAEGFPLTGELDEAEQNALFERAALAADVEARLAAKEATDAVKDQASRDFGPGAAIQSMTTTIEDNHIYGTVLYRNHVLFSGILEGGDLPEERRPLLGVFSFSKDCTVAFRVFEGPQTVVQPKEVLQSYAYGVLRRKEEFVPFGKQRALEADVCGPKSGGI